MLVYALYLIGRRTYGLSHSDLRTTIARYFFMSSLTGRYTGSFETQITQDAQAFTQATDRRGVPRPACGRAIDTTLTPDYWTITLPQALATSAARGPAPVRVRGVALSAECARAAVRRGGLRRGAEGRALHPRPLRSGLRPEEGGGRAAPPVSAQVPRDAGDHGHSAASTKSRTSPTSSGRRTSRSPTRRRRSTGPSTPTSSPPRTSSTTRSRRLGEDGVRAVPGGAPPADGRRHPGGLRDHRQRPGQPVLARPTLDTYLHPINRSRTTSAIRRIIRRLEGEVFWYEQHMTARRWRSCTTSCSSRAWTAVRLLSGPANITIKTKKASSASPGARRSGRSRGVAGPAEGAGRGAARASHRRRRRDL